MKYIYFGGNVQNIYAPQMQIVCCSPYKKTRLGQKLSLLYGPALWNALHVPIRNAETMFTSQKLLKSHLQVFDLGFPP